MSERLRQIRFYPTQMSELTLLAYLAFSSGALLVLAATMWIASASVNEPRGYALAIWCFLGSVYMGLMVWRTIWRIGAETRFEDQPNG